MIQVLKLITGEEIVAEVENTELDSVLISHAVMLAIQPKQDGSFGKMVLPYLTSLPDDAQVEIKNSHVMYQNAPNEDILQMHTNIFTKIAVPQQGIQRGIHIVK